MAGARGGGAARSGRSRRAARQRMSKSTTPESIRTCAPLRTRHPCPAGQRWAPCVPACTVRQGPAQGHLQAVCHTSGSTLPGKRLPTCHPGLETCVLLPAPAAGGEGAHSSTGGVHDRAACLPSGQERCGVPRRVARCKASTSNRTGMQLLFGKRKRLVRGPAALCCRC